MSISFQRHQSAPLQKGIQHWHAAAGKVCNVASGNDQTVVSRSRCNHRVLDAHRKTRAPHFIDQPPPPQSNLQGPIKAQYPTAHCLNHPFSGQLSSQSTKSALVSFSIPRFPADPLLTISILPAVTSASKVDPASAPKSRRTDSGRSICPSLVMVSVAVTDQKLTHKVCVRKPTLRLPPTSIRHSA